MIEDAEVVDRGSSVEPLQTLGVRARVPKNIQYMAPF